MWHQITSYLKFIFRATNQHGVHSPFVYDLVTKGFYQKLAPLNYIVLARHRKALLKDHTVISVNDYGAGSRVFKSHQRKVSAIAKHAGITSKRQRLLLQIVFYLLPKNILELGTSVGLATSAMAAGNPNATITSVEGCPETAAKARFHLEKLGIHNVNVVNSGFDDFLLRKSATHYDLIYLDGNHSKEATLSYFEHLLTKVSNDAVIIFDDIYWSKEMTEAWQEIIKNPKVTVSIDTFQWGLIFFRSEQPKQHFTIRV